MNCDGDKAKTKFELNAKLNESFCPVDVVFACSRWLLPFLRNIWCVDSFVHSSPVSGPGGGSREIRFPHTPRGNLHLPFHQPPCFLGRGSKPGSLVDMEENMHWNRTQTHKTTSEHLIVLRSALRNRKQDRIHTGCILSPGISCLWATWAFQVLHVVGTAYFI